MISKGRRPFIVKLAGEFLIHLIIMRVCLRYYFIKYFSWYGICLFIFYVVKLAVLFPFVILYSIGRFLDEYLLLFL